MTLRTLFSFEDTKKIQVYKYLTLFGTKEIYYYYYFDCNWKKLTDSSKRAKILADNCIVKATTALRPSYMDFEMCCYLFSLAVELSKTINVVRWNS